MVCHTTAIGGTPILNQYGEIVDGLTHCSYWLVWLALNGFQHINFGKVIKTYHTFSAFLMCSPLKSLVCLYLVSLAGSGSLSLVSCTHTPNDTAPAYTPPCPHHQVLTCGFRKTQDCRILEKRGLAWGTLHTGILGQGYLWLAYL